jgi:hypothetical protein
VTRLDADDKPCGCGRTHTAAQWAALEMVGTQPDYAGGALELRNCECGSTLSVPVEPDPDTEAGRVIDARAPWVRRLTAVVVGASAATACDNYEADRKREWEAPCRDESTLIATTAGSPDRAVCPNRQHKMRVAVTSGSTPNNAAAVIFCECTPKQEAK